MSHRYEDIRERTIVFLRKQRLLDTELDPELMATIERRLAEIDAGTAKMIPCDEAIARARAALEETRRSSRK
jgi:hypothetical protein